MLEHVGLFADGVAVKQVGQETFRLCRELVGEVDLKALEDIRRNWPFLRDRRIDSYGPITNRLID